MPGILEAAGRAGEILGNVGSASQEVGDVQGLINLLTQPSGVDQDAIQTELRRQRNQGDAIIHAETAQIESEITEGTSVAGNVKDIVVGGTLSSVFGGTVIETTRQGVQAAGEGIGLTGKIIAGIKSAGIIAVEGTLPVVAVVLGKGLIALHAVDQLVGLGEPIARIRVALAQRKVARDTINIVLDADRTQRTDNFVTSLMGRVSSINPTASEALGRTWNTRILDIAHKRAIAEQATKELSSIHMQEDGLPSVRAARRVARIVEGYHTDVLPDPQTTPRERAKALTESNYVQAKRVRGWDNRATTFNALAVLTIANLQQALQVDGLDTSARQELQARIAKVTALGNDLNKGWKGLFGGRLFANIMLTRPVIHFDKIQRPVREIQDIAAGSAAYLTPRQLETITQLTENLQVPGMFDSGRSNWDIRANGAELITDFRQTLSELRVTGEDRNRVTRADSLEQHIKELSQLRLISVPLRIPTILGEINAIIKAEGGLELGMKDWLNLGGYLLTEGSKLRNPLQDREVIDITRKLMQDAVSEARGWAVGSEKNVVANARHKIYDFVVSLIPFHDQLGFIFANRPFENLIPTIKVPGEN